MKLRRAAFAPRHPSSASRQADCALRQLLPRAHCGHSLQRHSIASKLVATFRSPKPGTYRMTGSENATSFITFSGNSDHLSEKPKGGELLLEDDMVRCRASSRGVTKMVLRRPLPVPALHQPADPAQPRQSRNVSSEEAVRIERGSPDRMGMTDQSIWSTPYVIDSAKRKSPAGNGRRDTS